MSDGSIFIAKLDDRAIIEAVEKVQKEFPNQLEVHFIGQFGEVHGEEIAAYRESGSLSLIRVKLDFTECSWTWYRLGPPDSKTYPQAAEYDRIEFRGNQYNGLTPQQRPVALAIDRTLKLALQLPLTEIDPSSPLSLATGREVLQALQTASQRLLTETAEHRTKLEIDFAAREAAREERFSQVRQQDEERLSQEREAAQVAHAERVAALDLREGELDSLKKTLDDRNNTHVRREIRSSLLDLTKERLLNFRVSPETRTQYILVHAVCSAGILFLLGLAAVTAVKFDSTLPPTAFALSAARSLLAGAAAIALGAWYLKWLNRWLQRIADAEFKLQQFRLDIERASWLTETVLEWNQSSKEPFPELLASRLSTGLFQSTKDDVEDPQTPASQLAEALLGSAASARLKIGDQELSLDRKGIRQLERPDAR
ncbi:TPA: hypothetical protein UMV35_000301 [Stenotrophomonas maltophilia]|uniref:hypothetical protein n=1 Tax=Stenotrophomonas TaxID=40323 RepID=UPI0008A2F983|nr:MULTISPECIES: hypothetical protein [Stenotrophomonas]MDH2021692.1 hypothetical protein [Stenotrophomonas sp. GD03680]OFU95353.1 hypothetical protein HMPREF3114_10720 [Stenotrophomonas sp. HMSC10F07]HDS1321651.1 hypothetical protein [Stenotrophomonas maltophilia]HDS1326260.1 hypothetical protein [Stenotrophomonas maltophilia]HDS1330966.1 hypothetical protein [Stenotrophomonas maltophilia]